MSVDAFEDQYDSDLFTLKFHSLDHVTEALERFESSEMANRFPFERYNVHVKQMCCQRLQRVATSLDETVEIMTQEIENQCGRINGKERKDELRKINIQEKLKERGNYLLENW